MHAFDAAAKGKILAPVGKPISGLAARSRIIVLTELSRIPLQYTYFLKITEGCQ